MSMRPSGSFSPSNGCRRSATQAPPVCRPIIAVAGVTPAFNCAASAGSSASASGSLLVIEKLFEQDLCGLRVERLAARELDRAPAAVSRSYPALGLHRAVALVHQPHRQ